MSNQKRFNDLSDLVQLLPEAGTTSNEVHNGKSVRIYLDTKGRKGKSVTIVAGLQHNPQTMEELAKSLKQYCGAGGTVKDGKIEVQGDQRKKVAEKLQSMNYVVKT